MSAIVQVTRPGRLWGDRPERPFRGSPGVLERISDGFAAKAFGRRTSIDAFTEELDIIQDHVEQLDTLCANDCKLLVDKLRIQMGESGLTKPLILKLFAVISRQMKEQLGLTPYPAQYFAGWSMLDSALVEMSTGEGKTLTVAFPAITIALTDTPVHVITVNEYLAERDAQFLAPLYRVLGLTVGLVTQGMSEENRRKAYAADVVYCTNKQVVFDYLRDVQKLQTESSGLAYRIRSLLSLKSYQPVQRGLCFAIVDEADSVLIDEARVPLILTDSPKVSNRSSVDAKVALGIARTLHEGADYTLHEGSKTCSLTDSGQEAARSLSDVLEGAWRFERYRSELLRQALTALHAYCIDRDYIVRDHQVILIDENTGRTMADRKLQNGLHQMLEIKEKCKPSDELETIASISYQRFFLKYHSLTGLSGTLNEVRHELKGVYDLDVIKIPPHLPSQMKSVRFQCFPDRSRQLAEMLDSVQQRHKTGQPILIGTRSVELSQRISDLLSACDVSHELLNAAQDQKESQIISAAGSPGAVTVATNMAGRGTDIPLRGNALELGGLHVINMEFNESSRIDRQLFGRSARQGAPGSGESLFSVADDVHARCSPLFKRLLSSSTLTTSIDPDKWYWPIIVRLIQWRYERAQIKQRRAVFHGYSELRRQLAVSGNEE